MNGPKLVCAAGCGREVRMFAPICNACLGALDQPGQVRHGVPLQPVAGQQPGTVGRMVQPLKPGQKGGTR